MGSTKVCILDESFVAAYGSPYKLDVRSFGSSRVSTLDEIGSSSGSTENILPDFGRSVTSMNMEANSFNLQSMTVKSSTFNCSSDIKGLKRPDKTLACPRCNSLDTKFCYYNNYNVNQPRHFCKGCQRYWTAGGTLRNVAIGAGRRKRKHSSLESESISEGLLVECPNAEDFSATWSASGDCKSLANSSLSKDTSGISCEAGNLRQKKLLPSQFDARSLVSDNILSAKVHGGLTHELIRAKQSLTSQHSSGPLCSTHDNREQSSIFHEFINSKFAAWGGKHVATCNPQKHGYEPVDLSKFSKAQVDSQENELKDVDSELVLAMPSERQASNESGCASSLTTQAVSVDACMNDGRSDGTDSEVTKGGEHCNEGGFVVASGSLQPAHHVSRQIAEGVPAACDVSQCNATGAGTLPPTALPWNGSLENPAFGAALAMLSMPLSWGAPADRGILWGLPWGPAASAVDAAKAALIPNTSAIQKPQAEPSSELTQKSQTVSEKVVEKSGQKLLSMLPLWGPSTDRGLSRGLPWAPPANAVDAAKAALVSNTTALQKPQSESWMGLSQKVPTVFNMAVEKSGVELSEPCEVRVWVPKTLRIKDVDEAARSAIWSTLGIRDTEGSLVSGKKEAAFQCHAKEAGIAAVKTQNANPVALSHSMAFQESS